MRRRSARSLLVGALVGVAAAAVDVCAQPADGPSPIAHHVMVSGGLTWTGGYPIGDRAAVLRGNATGATAPPFTLFRAESSVDASAGAAVGIGWALTRSVTVEFGVSYQHPGVTTAISQDAEIPAVTFDAERLSQYVFDVGVLWQLPRVRLGARARPFALAGGGYLRQLYDEHTLVEQGSVYYAGGGVRYWLRGGDGTMHAVGVRGDARILWRFDGVEFEGKTRAAPVLSVLAFFEF